jgi:hypothetical protein
LISGLSLISIIDYSELSGIIRQLDVIDSKTDNVSGGLDRFLAMILAGMAGTGNPHMRWAKAKYMDSSFVLLSQNDDGLPFAMSCLVRDEVS